MKMTLKDRIALSQELLMSDSCQNDHQYMISNDRDVVFYASAIVGSKLSRRHSDILMNRNDIPRRWYSNSSTSDCKINFGFKKAFAKVIEYSERGFDITPGRMLKLLEIISCEQSGYSKMRNNRLNNEALIRYLRNLNNLRMHCVEMSDAEIYDFSFDMVYDFFEEFTLYKDTLYLSFMLMYWLQYECDLLPLAVSCKEGTYLSMLNTIFDNELPKKDGKKEFRQFIRGLLDSHLTEFIRDISKYSGEKIKSRDRILKLLKDNPTHTAKTMASCMGLSVQGVQKQILNLKKENRLKRIGPDNGGRWEVIEK